MGAVIRPGGEAKVARESAVPPLVRAAITTPAARVEVLEWDWPDPVEHINVESELMLELLLPPFSTTGSASFPTIAPDSECHFGTLFIRYPGVAIRTSSTGGLTRMLRVTFARHVRDQILGERQTPSLTMLQRLINLRVDPIRAHMRMLLGEIEAPSLGTQPAIAALTQLLAIEVTRLLDQDLAPRPGGRLAPWQFKRIRDRLEAGGSRPSVPELAQLCGISVRHLHRQFLNLTGVTISDYVEAHLVDRAKVMLCSSVLSVKQIARSAGFEHANSFARTFRRATGITPLQYRQRKSGHGEGAAPPR